MHNPMSPRHAWSTASCSDAVKSYSTDLRLLGEHLNACPQLHRHLLTLHRFAVSVHGFVATRFVTTLVVMLVLFGFGFLVL